MSSRHSAITLSPSGDGSLTVVVDCWICDEQALSFTAPATAREPLQSTDCAVACNRCVDGFDITADASKIDYRALEQRLSRCSDNDRIVRILEGEPTDD